MFRIQTEALVSGPYPTNNTLSTTGACYCFCFNLVLLERQIKKSNLSKLFTTFLWCASAKPQSFVQFLNNMGKVGFADYYYYYYCYYF